MGIFVFSLKIIIGTHVAGTIASARYGVSKRAKVVAIKVLRSNGSGTMSDVIKGVEYAAQLHLNEKERAKKEGRIFKGSGANMSLGGGKSQTLDSAVNGVSIYLIFKLIKIFYNN
jgi:cerevisin